MDISDAEDTNTENSSH